MTYVISIMAFCRNADKQKMSCYDKNVTTPFQKSEFVGYVKVRFFAHPLTRVVTYASMTSVARVFTCVRAFNPIFIHGKYWSRRWFCNSSNGRRLIESAPRRYDNIHINLAKIDSADTRSNEEILDDMKYSLEKW